MVTILLRTVIIYILLSLAMRLMGKRQLGQLELSELVTTLLLSEIAAMPVTDHEIPVMFAVIPIITLIVLEISSSVILIKFPKLKNLLSSRPNEVICKGKVNQRELKRVRMSTDELLSSLRLNGCSDISQVYSAIIEENGSMTVVPKASGRTPTAADLNIDLPENGIPHVVVSDGKFDSHGLSASGIGRSDAEAYLSSHGCDISSVFLLLCDDAGNYTLIIKDNNR